MSLRVRKPSANTRFVLLVTLTPPLLFILAWVARAALGAWYAPKSMAETYSLLTFVVGFLGFVATLAMFAWPFALVILAVSAYRDRRDRRRDPVELDV